jgi:hypothetical protein
MRKLFALGALVAGVLSLGAFGAVHADTTPGGAEGCIVSTPGANSPAGTLYTGGCSYKATRAGGFVTAAQAWKVTVTHANGTQTVYTQAGKPCNLASTVAGDTVTVSGVVNGVVAAGNPFPSATDGHLGSTTDYCASAP